MKSLERPNPTRWSQTALAAVLAFAVSVIPAASLAADAEAAAEEEAAAAAAAEAAEVATDESEEARSEA